MTTDRTPAAAPKRSRARTFVPLGILVWLGVEIWLMILVAGVAGAVTVLLLLLGGAVLGAVVMKRAGRRAFRNLTETIQRQQQQMRQHPGEALSPPEGGGRGNGFLMLAGLLIMLPGLLSDVVGLLLLVPPVRAVVSRFAERSLERRMRAAVPGSLGDAFEQARMRQPDGKVVQGEVIRKDERRSSRHEDGGPRPPLTR